MCNSRCFIISGNLFFQNGEVWGTALGATWLESNFAEQRLEWDMIHNKAVHFMAGQDLRGGSVEGLLQKASEAIR